MPTHTNISSRSGRRRTRRSRNSSTSVSRLRQQLPLGMAGSNADDHFVSSDLTYNPVSPVFAASPPKNLLNQIHWVRQNTNSTVTTSTTVLTETNYAFTSVADLQHQSSYFSVFDQYCLHSVVFTILNTNSNASVLALPEVFTAIDYDNVTALGSINGITAFASCNTGVLAAGKSITRYVRPTVQTSVSTFASAAVTRQWIATALPSVPFFGIRTIIAATTAAALTLDVSISCVWAFRSTV